MSCAAHTHVSANQQAAAPCAPAAETRSQGLSTEQAPCATAPESAPHAAHHPNPKHLVATPAHMQQRISRPRSSFAPHARIEAKV
eukprot:12282-Pyramimonas_sp.AAC.1